MIKLGISAFYHDSAACITNGNLVLAAAEEERFTGIKHDSSFPINAIKWLISSTVRDISQIQEVHWYENPEKKDDRVKTIFNKRPIKTFFLRQRYNKDRKNNSPEALLKNLGYTGKIIYHDHHYSHAAFSYYTSPYRDAAILTVDGVGEWETTTISKGEGKEIKKLISIDFPNSLGMLYSTITSYLGFRPNEGEYKVMGLAPYGNKTKYIDKLYKVLTNTSNKYFINQKYFTWEYSNRVMFTKELCKLLDIPPRLPEEPLTQEHKDLAASLQKLYENEFIKLLETAKNITKSNNICLGGGCAYNGVANALAYKYFDKVYIPFAPSDAGSAIGACLDNHSGVSPYLGTSFTDKKVAKIVSPYKKDILVFKLSEEVLIKKVAELIQSQKIIAWFQGSMEFGARALGNRSILASPVFPNMREKLNKVIKKREGFRPFAPSVPLDNADRFFDLKEPSPYMNKVVKGKTKLIPSATHIDGTCRVQTVTSIQNPKYYKLLKEVGRLTQIPVLLNTSFNIQGKPILNTYKEAMWMKENTGIDEVITNKYIL